MSPVDVLRELPSAPGRAQAVEECARVCDARVAGMDRAYTNAEMPQYVLGAHNEAACLAIEIRALPSEPAEDSVRAFRDVLSERRRQFESEGWTPEHDDNHEDAALAVAGACFAFSTASQLRADSSTFWHNRYARVFRDLWPWAEEWRKPKTPRHDLVRAAALIIAEIERLDRAALLAAHSDRSEK